MDSNPAEAKVMRAIIARVGKRERAARREHQAAHRQAIQPKPSDSGWDKKLPKGAKPAAPSTSAPAALNRKRWAQQNPHAAASERAMRVALARRDDAFSHKAHGTPATHAEARQHFPDGPGRRDGALARLFNCGAVDKDQLAAATEIVAAAEQLRSEVSVRTASLETRVDKTRLGDGTFYEKLGQVRREIAYGAWRQRLGRHAPAILAIIVDDLGLVAASREFRTDHKRLRGRLIAALDLWPVCYADACRDVDHATLAAAQAAIL